MIRYNEIVDRTEPYNNPSDNSYQSAGVAPTTLAPPSERGHNDSITDSSRTDTHIRNICNII